MSSNGNHKKKMPASDEMRKRLEKNPDVLLQLLPIIFHKLKNKLTPILGYAQILKTTCKNEAEASRLQKIESGALDFAELLNKLKEYFLPGKKEKSPANINAILKTLEKGMQASCDARGIRFSLELDPTIPDGRFHVDEIRALALEMVDNAMHSLMQKGAAEKTIAVSTRREPEGYALKVRDDGIGVAPELQDKIWTPFFSTEEHGAGLGLVLCEKIIANHQASCSLDSRVGEYCEFAVLFPAPAIH